MWYVAYILRFIWYEKFRTCVISPSDPQRHEYQSTFSWFCFITPIQFSFYLSLPTLMQHTNVHTVHDRCPSTENTERSMLKQWRQTKPALTPPLFLFSALPLSVNSFQLPNEQRWLLIDSANSKTISGVAKTTQLMIYSLLILKTSGMSRGIVWALLSDFWEPSSIPPSSSHLPPPCAPSCLLSSSSCSPDRHSDNTEWWRGRHAYWRDNDAG